jgi:hypothetical protein
MLREAAKLLIPRFDEVLTTDNLRSACTANGCFHYNDNCRTTSRRCRNSLVVRRQFGIDP